MGQKQDISPVGPAAVQQQGKDDMIMDDELYEYGEEVDNDSPYRVKITLDQLFLSYLEDSYITRGAELKDRYRDVLKNENFR